MASKSDSSILTNGYDPLSITLQNSNFIVNDHIILSDVPSNITTTPPSIIDAKKPPSTPPPAPGCFVGFNAPTAASRHVNPIGKLKNTKFMSIFRFKLWWTTHWTGENGRDIEYETQLLLLNNNPSLNKPYILILPIIEPPFRASLQPGSNDNIDICVESGSEIVTGQHYKTILYMEAGDDPFRLVKDAMRVIKNHLGTFKLLEEKKVPSIVDKFGWCTWDAFYLRVHPKGVMEGVNRLVEGGTPPKMVLIDDGWQSICKDDGEDGMNMTEAGEQMPCRLVKVEENWKFKEYKSGNKSGEDGMKGFVRDLKDGFGVEEVYVWHALCGYWGGVRAEGLMEMLKEVKLVKPKLSDGAKMTMEDLAVDKIVNNGVGLVSPEMVKDLYERMHSHLESVGIDGVKVDVIHILELLCEEYGGRIELAKSYYSALTASINTHFNGNGCIASMEHCNDFMLLGTKSISLGRVGDDFWCTDSSGDPNGTYWLQGCHMAHCAYNSYWMGNFIQPDWDMFQSTHPCAEFHAASRAISGGPVYVSDKVGEHDFELLRKLVLPDGKVLRCEWYALPTRDCLFKDPLHDGETGLKIWNVNRFNGVVGVFNCQGGGWNRENRRNQSYSECARVVNCKVKPDDVEWKNVGNKMSSAPAAELVEGVVKKFVMYFYKEKKVVVVSDMSEMVELSLDPFTFELITVVPIVGTTSSSTVVVVEFAPIGLVNMLNSGGAIQSFELDDGGNTNTNKTMTTKTTIRVGLKGSGEMKAFASMKPTGCKIDGKEVEFEYDDRLVTIQVPWPGSSSILSVIEYLF